MARGPHLAHVKVLSGPAQYFLKISVPPILAEIQLDFEDRFHVQTSFYLVFFPRSLVFKENHEIRD